MLVLVLLQLVLTTTLVIITRLIAFKQRPRTSKSNVQLTAGMPQLMTSTRRLRWRGARRACTKLGYHHQAEVDSTIGG